jgi:hypothetical protein
MREGMKQGAEGIDPKTLNSLFKTLSKFTSKTEERGNKNFQVNEHIKEVDESLSSLNEKQSYGLY